MIYKDEITIKYEKLSPFKRHCRCGHSVFLVNRRKKICSWCGHYVYISPLEEFKDKLRYELKKLRNEEIHE